MNLGGRTVLLDPARAIGKGGEADVYDIGGGRALKIFKPPDHPDFEGSPAEQQGARQRLQDHQKKLPAFPKGLPPHVVVPEEFAMEGRRVVGYSMRFLRGAEVLYRYGEKPFREGTGIPDDDVTLIFRDLRATVSGLHDLGMVIGDFNDLNVLVNGTEAYLIDADSMQFGDFLCRMFTVKFVDPLLCDPAERVPRLVRPHTEASDWYAFNLMLFQCLLFVGPYGGVHKPKDGKKQIPNDSRALHRLTVFDSEVRYPKHARHFGLLPDELLHYFHRVFEKDSREATPSGLLDQVRWTTCTKCGKLHARPSCPDCTVPEAAVTEVITAKVSARKVFETAGRILYSSHQGGSLKWVYHEGDTYKREDGSLITRGPLDFQMRCRINGARTVLAKGPVAFLFTPGGQQPERFGVETYLGGPLPLIDANADGVFLAQDGQLKRVASILGVSTLERVGDVLSNQTLFWVGETVGFGFYRAGDLCQHILFNPKGTGINDTIKLPPIRGQLLDSACLFSKSRIWFFTSTQESGRTLNRCLLLDHHGNLLASTECSNGEDHWLGSIRGKCAIGDILLVATDNGIVRVQAQGLNLSVVKEFPDTARFVDTNRHLFTDKNGLMVVNGRSIWELRVS